MLSRTSDHALRAILVLARMGKERPLRADEIARAIGAPSNYLAKTLNLLSKAGILESARGPFGGFTLAIPANALTLSRVIDCFDEPQPQRHCLLGAAPCDPATPCAAHLRWAAIRAAIRDPLATTTIADLLADPTSSRSTFQLGV